MTEPEGAAHEPDAPEPSADELALVRKEEDAAPVARTVAKPDLRSAGGSYLQRKVTYLPDVHRLLPQSPDAERGALSSFLLSPREVGGMCVERRITPGHFFNPAHEDIFRVLMELWDANKEIDFITLTQVLRDRGKLDACGGAAYATELFTFLPTAANCAYYLEILQEKRDLRRIIEVGTEYAARAYDAQDEAPQLLEAFEREACAISDLGGMSEMVGMKQGIVEAIGHIEQLYERRGAIGGISTGFADYDKLTDGLQRKEMTVIAARPSVGKTALAMNMADHIAVNLKLPIAIFSLEMSGQQLRQRLLCSRARVDLTRVRDGFLSDRDFPALQEAASKLAESKMFIDDSSGLTIQEVRAKARRLKTQHDIQAVFIDYLQLVRSLSKQAINSREREISEISAGCKDMAKELDLPVVVLAQLKRGRDESKRERPRISDLRESGSIEQDADTVALLVREEYFAETEEERQRLEGQATLIIGKQRNGPVADVHLTFLREFTRFETRATSHEEAEEEKQTGLAL